MKEMALKDVQGAELALLERLAVWSRRARRATTS